VAHCGRWFGSLHCLSQSASAAGTHLFERLALFGLRQLDDRCSVGDGDFAGIDGRYHLLVARLEPSSFIELPSLDLFQETNNGIRWRW
jgi:hypothetical protein